MNECWSHFHFFHVFAICYQQPIIHILCPFIHNLHQQTLTHTHTQRLAHKHPHTKHTHSVTLTHTNPSVVFGLCVSVWLGTVFVHCFEAVHPNNQVSTMMMKRMLLKAPANLLRGQAVMGATRLLNVHEYVSCGSGWTLLIVRF
jgi:hypothetical protein